MTDPKDTPEEDDGLTDEERAALAGPEDQGAIETKTEENDRVHFGSTDEEVKAAEDAAIAEAEAEAARLLGEDDKGEIKPDEAPPAETKPDEGATTEEKPGETKTDEEQKPEPPAQKTAAPLLVADVPDNAEAKFAEFKERKSELNTKFNDGDITAAEYQEGLDAVGKEERALERQIDKAEIAADLQKQQARNSWQETCNDFIYNRHPEYSKNARLYRALDSEIKDLASSEEGKDLTGSQILEKAHANLTEAFGLGKPAVPTQALAPAPVAAKAPAAPPPVRDVPKTLAKVPAADVSDAGNNRFAALDRLRDSGDTDAYEDAYALLTPRERDDYLKS